MKTFQEYWREYRSDLIMVVFFFLCSVALFLIEPFHTAASPPGGEKVRGRVVAVDNAGVERHGMVTAGVQLVTLKILDGHWRGRELRGANSLLGRADVDKLFAPGDVAWTAIKPQPGGAPPAVNAQDHYRIGKEIWLFGLFALLLVVFSGWVGVKSLLSFVFTCLVIWRLVVPLCLRGYHPILVSLGAVLLLAAAIIYLVAGCNDKGTTACCGAVAGVLASCLLGLLFTHAFRIDGAVMPYSQALFFAGFEYLDLTDIYIGGIYLASSGAVMDLAMDVAAGMKEVITQRPDLPRRELMWSGIRIGRTVVGTMTTTLLLAYSGGYLTMIMTFAAEGVGTPDFMNYPYVAAEAAKTLVGSIGLVLVAPFTAVVGAILLRPERDGGAAAAARPSKVATGGR
ncbi:MAG: YibE/F family protein [Victivallales bacterium]|nr:YibE/F family protein [Victivallales bacterium]